MVVQLSHRRACPLSPDDISVHYINQKVIYKHYMHEFSECVTELKLGSGTTEKP